MFVRVTGPTIDGARLLLTTDAVGGVWTYTLDLASGLRARGAVVRIAVLGPAPTVGQRAALAQAGLDALELDCPLEWLAADAAAVRGAARAVAAAARSWGADLVHLHTPAFAGAGFGCPVVATNHSCVATWWAAVRGGPLPADLAWRAAMVAEGLRRADRVLAPTDAYAKAVAAVYGLADPPTAVHNGRAAPDTGADRPPCAAFFTAGRLWDPGKNVAALDRVAADLPWPVRAAGDLDGPDGSSVSFSALDTLGRLSAPALREQLAARPVFVAPARFEPFGLAVLEAAQAGCALVLNDIATFRELWDGAALFVDADDPAALSAALHAVIADAGRRDSLGRAARTRADRYGVDAMVEGTLAAYATCLGAPEALRA